MEFTIGDTVQLKSGGPVMTIEARNDSGSWHCIWFDKTDLKRGNFKAETLEKFS